MEEIENKNVGPLELPLNEDNLVKNDDKIENKTEEKVKDSQITEKSNKNSDLKEILIFFRDIIIIILIVLFVRKFLILPFQISGQSMSESYTDREFIIVDRLSYLDIPKIWEIRAPKRWDVVVFNTHITWKEYFIKRIIWLPWETIKVEWWEVYVKENSKTEFSKLDETYLSFLNYWFTSVLGDEKEYIYEIPENSYFVMWDNRNWSTDSRTCFRFSCWEDDKFYVTKKDIVWKVLVDLWYFNFKTLKFKNPLYETSTVPRFLSSPSTHDYNLK